MISVVERENIVRGGKGNIDSLKVLLTANTNANGKSKSYASKQTVTKIGESGLALKHLELSFEGLEYGETKGYKIQNDYRKHICVF